MILGVDSDRRFQIIYKVTLDLRNTIWRSIKNPRNGVGMQSQLGQSFHKNPWRQLLDSYSRKSQEWCWYLATSPQQRDNTQKLSAGLMGQKSPANDAE